MPTHWFDAHLDLACAAALGRDMARSLAEATGPWPPAAVTLPSLRDGQVTHALPTIFTEADGTDPGVSYPAGDAEAAHAAGLFQLDQYEKWEQAGLLTIHRPGAPAPTGPRLHCRFLMECADPIREPSELPWWANRGVAVIGLAWGRGSRYAAGNSQDPATDHGLTQMGRELVAGMDAFGVVHDASHLSDRALADLLEATDKPVIASHSNCRSIVARHPLTGEAIPESLRTHPDGARIALQRHLTDDTIREISRRGAVIGLNLYSPFLIPGALRSRRATIEETVAHVEHICSLVGHTRAVGLGSDMDGGFSAATLPDGINSPGDLPLLLDALAQRGWTTEDLDRFAWKNWLDFFAAVDARSR
ncbi:MAG: membrane dipeptidase [Phycisphaerales bacterium]